MGTSRLTSSPLSLLCCVVDESSLNHVRLVTRGAPHATTSAAEGPQTSGWIDVRGSDIFICAAFSHTRSYIHTYKAGLVKSCARVNAPAIVCVWVRVLSHSARRHVLRKDVFIYGLISP